MNKSCNLCSQGTIGKAIKKLSKIVAFVRKSNIDTETLRLAKSVGFKIPMSNETRWSSQYNMIDKFLCAVRTDSTLQSRLRAF